MTCQSCGSGAKTTSDNGNDRSQIVNIAKTLGSLAVFNTKIAEKSKKTHLKLNQDSSKTSKMTSTTTNINTNKTGDDLVFDSLEDSEKFYKLPSSSISNPNLKPWKEDKYHFQTVHISLIALIKMTLHARSGGSIEIMGVMTGKVFGSDMVIMDCYPLPVEGSESRVNAQNEAYEFMLQYLNALRSIKGREENIIGWYHSHPGFGCWLSGIDVQTQALNQGFQDPYVAVVIDPERSIKQGLVEIGAFRTLPEEKRDSVSISVNGMTSIDIENKQQKGTKNMGFHQDKYYSLNIRLFENPNDRNLLELLANEFWFNSLENLSNEDYSKSLKKLESLKKSLNQDKQNLGGSNNNQVISNITKNSNLQGKRNQNNIKDLDLLNDNGDSLETIGLNTPFSDIYEKMKKSSRPLSNDSLSPPGSKRRLTQNQLQSQSQSQSQSKKLEEHQSKTDCKMGKYEETNRPVRELTNGASKSIRDLQIAGIQQMKKVFVRSIQEDLFK